MARYNPRGARPSFSGSGEDIIVSDLLNKMGLKSIFYLDIGAHNPIFGNNTYLFHRNGGKGILIEPNKILCEEIKNKRPKDVCLNVGVGKIDGKADFFNFKRNTRNTFSVKEAEAWEKISGNKPEIIKQPIVSLNSIVDNYCKEQTFDFVSIDTEGFEYEILQGFNWKVRPRIFCLETASPSGNIVNDDLNSLMNKNGYILCAKTLINSIYIDKKYNL